MKATPPQGVGHVKDAGVARLPGERGGLWKTSKRHTAASDMWPRSCVANCGSSGFQWTQHCPRMRLDALCGHRICRTQAAQALQHPGGLVIFLNRIRHIGLCGDAMFLAGRRNRVGEIARDRGDRTW